MPSSWKKWLRTLAATPAAPTSQPNQPPRIAILGIGNEMNGDDAAGVIAVRRLIASAACGSERLLLLEAGLAPENFTGPLRRFNPDLVLLLDAAEMGAKPGSIQVLDWRDSAGFGPSTHLQPPSTLAEFLMAELGCQVALIGIQPASLDFELRLTPPVRRAVTRLATALREALCPSS